MKHMYNVLMDETYIRDAQMIDTTNLTDDELFNLDFSAPETEDLCHDIEPRHLVATIAAESEDEAIDEAAKACRYDRRVLYAEEIVMPES